jgi:hypothetical protein
MNTKTKAAIYTLALLLWSSAIVGSIIKYPEQSKFVLIPIFAIGGIFWLYKLIYYMLENK